MIDRRAAFSRQRTSRGRAAGGSRFVTGASGSQRRTGGSELDDGLAQALIGHAQVVQYLGRKTFLDRETAQGEVAGSDVVVAKSQRLAQGVVEDGLSGDREMLSDFGSAIAPGI